MHFFVFVLHSFLSAQLVTLEGVFHFFFIYEYTNVLCKIKVYQTVLFVHKKCKLTFLVFPVLFDDLLSFGGWLLSDVPCAISQLSWLLHSIVHELHWFDQSYKQL